MTTIALCKPSRYGWGVFYAVPIALDILYVLLGVVLPAVLFLNARRGKKSRQTIHWTPALKVRMYYANGILLLGLAVLTLTFWHFTGRPFTDLGLGWGRTPYDPLAITIIFAFLALYGVDLYAEAGSPQRQQHTHEKFRELGFLPTTGTQYLHFLFLCACAGVGEEIVYRGFLITYSAELLGDTVWGVVGTLVLPAVPFGLAHIYQGAHAVFKIVAMALLFGFFFYRTGSLWPLILLHTAIDAVGGLLSWYLEEHN